MRTRASPRLGWLAREREEEKRAGGAERGGALSQPPPPLLPLLAPPDSLQLPTAMEGPEKEEGQVPPIATTPPRQGPKEELLSQSSSGTQVSYVSGISLGEAIRHRSTANQEMKTWYQPHVEIDTSNLPAALGRRLSQSSGTRDLTEFPSMEEGSITVAEDSRKQQAPNVTHTRLLEAEDSRLSPNLPLMTTYSTQGRTFFNETLFQQTGTDFAPLRGTPDASNVASEESSSHLRMSEAVRLAATDVSSDSSLLSDYFKLSQHPLAFSSMAPSNTSLGSCLSQHPLSFSGPTPREQAHHSEQHTQHLDARTETLGSSDENLGIPGSQKQLNPQSATSLPPNESWGQDLFLLDSRVPAPVLLEILEKEVGLSKHSGFLSSESSSGKSGKDPVENEMSPLMENVVLGERELETFAEPPGQERRTVPECDSLNALSYSEGKHFRNTGNSEQLSPDISNVSFRGQRMGLGDSCLIPGISSNPFLSKQELQHVSEAAFEEQKKLVPAFADAKLHVPAPHQPVFVAAEHGNIRNMVDIQMGDKSELMHSDFSIEREHKDVGISPSFNEGSFILHLAHPVHHSTPGIFTTRSLTREVPAMTYPVKAVLQSSLPCLHEEFSNNSCSNTFLPSVEEPRVPSLDDTCIPSAGEPLALQSGQASKDENSGGLQVLYPLKGRIQSLPSLNFMEKVGAWNMSHSAERMSDALALHGSSGASPRQKAYSAIADSLNRILLKQQSQADLKAGLAASFYGPNSMTNLHVYDKNPPQVLPLTRSQSENSVVALSREMPRAEVGHETSHSEDLHPVEDKGRVSGASGVKQSDANIEDAHSQHYTAVLVSTVSSDEEIGESATGGNPDNFISSERVAELLREDASFLSGSQEKTDGCQDNTRELPGFLPCTNQISLGHFSDVSPDSLNQRTSPGTGSCADLRLSSRQSSRRSSTRSSVVSGKLHGSLEEVFKTPYDREINIEERIPVYLHNLGIDQSPSSILTPFMPRGPVREIEFSPTELRTLKTSNDLLARRLQLSEGDSASVIDALQSSFDSSIHGWPAPAGSHPGTDLPLPTEFSHQPSRDCFDQGSIVCHQLELHTPTPEPREGTFESSAPPKTAEQSHVTPEWPSNIHSGEGRSPKCVQRLMDRFDSKELGVSQDQLSPSSLAHGKGEESVSQKISSSAVLLGGEEDCFFIGSETLKEIQKILAEAETRSPSRNFKSASSISSTDLDSSLKQIKKMDGSGDSGLFKGSSPGIQRMWSWDETLARQSVHSYNVLPKTASFTGSLKCDGQPAADVLSNDQILPEESMPPSQVTVEEHRTVKPVRRSEPEGCNSATVNKSLPVFVDSAADSKLFTPKDLKELAATSSAGSLDSASNIWEEGQQVLQKTRKEMGGSHGSGNSSSVDSLGIKVKNLLRCERPVLHTTQWGEGEKHNEHSQKQVSAGARVACSKGDLASQESENGSSLDSLAARVKTLLEDERPVMHAAQILQSAEEEEEKAHAWVKLKLTLQPADAEADLNEEDRRMIEEIKRMQLLSARIAGNVKDGLRGNSYERISSCSSILKTDTELSKTSSDSELQKDIRIQDSQLAECPVIRAAQPRVVCGTDRGLPDDSEITSLTSDQSHVSDQPRTHSENLSDSSHNVHTPLRIATDTSLQGLTGTTKAATGKEVSVSAQAKLAADTSSTESAKQITSITFASRKRTSSSRVPCASIPEASPLETQSISNEQLESSKLHVGTPQPCASASMTAVHAPDKSVEFRPGGDGHRHAPMVVSKEAYPQEKSFASMENSQPICSDQKVHSVAENREETQTASQGFTGIKRYDRPSVNTSDNKSNPGETVADPLRPFNPPQQKAKDVSQDVSRSFAGIPKPHFPTGKESTLTKENKSASDQYLCRAEAMDTGSSSPLSTSSQDHISTTIPVSPSSPTRKALSGVHMTLSPKHVELPLPSLIDAGAEKRRVGGFTSDPHPATLNDPSHSLEATSNFKPTERFTSTQDSAYFPRSPTPDSHFKHSHVPVVAKPAPSQEPLEIRQIFPVTDRGRVPGSYWQSPEENLKTTASSQTERMSSDAITQITTESPERATYSAEIFVSNDSGDVEALRPSHRKSHEMLGTAAAPVSHISVLNRQAGTPRLLPYKPPGSSEMYYVPCPKETLRLSRVRSETTMESSHSGSNDATPPKFPAQALGSGDEIPPSPVAIKHREGIYSKRAVPKEAWTGGDAQEGVKGSPKVPNRLESVAATHSVFRSAQFYLHHPVPLQHEIDFLAGNDALGQYAVQERPALPSKDIFQYDGTSRRGQAVFSLHQPTGEERFSPPNFEPDYSVLEELRFNETLERGSPRKELQQPDVRKSGHKLSKGQLLPSSQRSSLKEKRVADLPEMQSAPFTGSLDELWAKYLERQKQHQQRSPSGSSRSELSLVERLDRLARLLQNPVRHTLVPVKDEDVCVQVEPKGKESKKISSQANKAYKGRVAIHSPRGKAEESPEDTSNTRLSKSRHCKVGSAAALYHMDRNLEQRRNSAILSDTSSEMRPVKDCSVLTDITSDSEVTQPETDTASRTEASVSVSTIDTERLIRAFGHDRVQVSPKLSQLYSAIRHQKTRSEKYAKGSRKDRAADYQRTAHAEPKRKETQATDSFISSDSVSTLSSSLGPSPALSSKRSRRMLNKAVQAGDFEIVNSATKKHTRDVGLTFPTPTPSQARLREDPESGTEGGEFAQLDGFLLESKGKQRRQHGRLLAEKKPRRNKPRWRQGVSWFVSAKDMKPDFRKGSSYVYDPDPSWFEAVPDPKPWREPLREKNWQEEHSELQVCLMAPSRDVENKPPPTFVKMTLQESLALHRPDFISSSGERVKRLKLIMEERKLQSMLQGEREELFNAREERRSFHLPNRDYRAMQKRRAISKNEMVQRSKRIYEQLPEVRKRREEEKRKSDYSTNRLKAQLYKMKVTNHILGRKVPWE
uniref:LOW QUALITY PROTEIN: Alstrom syndrome protein 1 n=1 Tax=Podarcis muralis TaxID=64176 RepID=UPI00109FDAF3|nr:LOW QUALITY PROTEIN: Alstrom syndrome protein 1 [Podarcis muralis]